MPKTMVAAVKEGLCLLIIAHTWGVYSCKSVGLAGPYDHHTYCLIELRKRNTNRQAMRVAEPFGKSFRIATS